MSSTGNGSGMGAGEGPPTPAPVNASGAVGQGPPTAAPIISNVNSMDVIKEELLLAEHEQFEQETFQTEQGNQVLHACHTRT